MRSYLQKILLSSLLTASLFSSLLLRAKGDEELLGSSHLIFGVPQNVDILLMRKGFSLGYSEKHKQALWVSYILKKEDLKGKYSRKNMRFRKDPAIKIDPVTPNDYRKTGFDRGHLAPAGDMAYHLETLKESFYMTNITPQYPSCNRGIWKRLENMVRAWAEKEGKLCVITGPVFTSSSSRKLGRTQLPVPCAFYKVILDMTPPVKMIGFVIPNTSGQRDPARFAMSIKEVEKAAGNTFFHLLNHPEKEKLKSSFSHTLWGMKKNPPPPAIKKNQEYKK